MSDSMSDLSQKAHEAETRAKQSREMTHEQLQEYAARTRAAAQQRQQEMNERNAKAKDDLAANWENLTAHVNEQRDKMHAKIQGKRDEHDAKVAQRRADRAENYAIAAVDFALDAIAEAEAAVLDATDARVLAEAKATS
jgi:hypothetical protein